MDIWEIMLMKLEGDITVYGRCVNTGNWIKLKIFGQYKRDEDGNLIDNGSWWCSKLVENKDRLQNAVEYAKTLLNDNKYQDIVVNDHNELYMCDLVYDRDLWKNGRWV